MHIIFDDFRLNARTHSYEEIRKIVDASQAVPDIGGRTRAASYRGQQGLHQITQTVTHRGIKAPKVYRKRTSTSVWTSVYAVIMPTLDNRQDRWMSYVLDTDKNAFTNLGPVNGAITESMHMPLHNRGFGSHGYLPQYEVKKLYTIRIDEDTGVPFVMRIWTSPDRVTVTALKMINYGESHIDGTISYDGIEVGVWAGLGVDDIKRRFTTFKTVEQWDEAVPGMTFDMTATDFPLSNYDLVSALYVD